MKYLLFGSRECFYARGGWNDFLKSFETLEEAKEAGKTWRVRLPFMDDEDFKEEPPVQWWHVVDLSAGKIVAHSDDFPYGGGPTEDDNK